MNGVVGSGPDAHVVKGGVRRVTIEGETEETVERDGARVIVKTTYHQYVPAVQILHPATGVRAREDDGAWSRRAGAVALAGRDAQCHYTAGNGGLWGRKL